MFRINRYVRFSRDKRPYKDHIDLWFWHGNRRGWDSPGFFFRMSSDLLVLAAGMHRFEKAQLDAFRNAVIDPQAGRALAKTVEQVRKAGPYEIGGATRKTVPRGFEADHEGSAFLLHNGLFATFEGEPGKVSETPGFIEFCLGHFRRMWPISRWLLDEVTESRENAEESPALL